MSNLETGISMQNKHISSSLMEKILAVKDNSLVELFFKVYKTEATGKGIKNVTIKNSGKMTFLPKGKESLVNTSTFPSVWKKDGRQEGSFGKVLRKLLVENGNKKIVDRELEEIVNVLKAAYTVEGTFEIVEGGDISRYYLDEKYDYNFNIGTLDGSCMRYDGACQTATEFYADNENCKMIILKSPIEDKIRGRALLWETRAGSKVMDRVYACDHIIEAFKEFAKSNGWIYKYSQDSSSSDWVENGDRKDLQIIVDMETHHEILPYMDSIYYIYDGFISNKGSDLGSYSRYAQTEPDEQENNEWDSYDECYIDPDEAVYIENMGYTTHSDNAFYCDIENEYFLHDNGVRLHDGRTVYEESDSIVYVDHEGEWYHVDDVTFCDFNNEDYPENKVEFIGDLDMNVFEGSINEAYEDAGWVKDEDDEWVDPQYQLI